MGRSWGQHSRHPSWPHGPHAVTAPGREAGDGTGEEKGRPEDCWEAGGAESPLREASLDHVSPQHHRLKSHLYSLLSLSFRAARVLQCHPETRQKCLHEKSVEHLKRTPPAPMTQPSLPFVLVAPAAPRVLASRETR